MEFKWLNTELERKIVRVAGNRRTDAGDLALSGKRFLLFREKAVPQGVVM